MRIIIPGLACVILSIVIDALFLPHQSLWNDETTQLAGLSLNPVQSTMWLAGRYDLESRSGVGADRMPPLSYVAGWTWSQVFGQGEQPMRWFGVSCVALAIGVTYSAATRAWGMASGIVASLLLATSPNVIVTSVEIRAYPALILASSGLCACLIGFAESPPESRKKWLMGMLACGVAAMYLHFFGLVILGGCLVGAFLVARAKGEKVLPVVATGFLAGLFALGLAPFIFASRSNSNAVSVLPIGLKIMGLVRLIYRLFSHPSMAVSTLAVGLGAVGLTLGVCSGLARKRRSGWASIGLALTMVSGLTVVTLAHLAQSIFPAISPSYNIWLLPTLALFIASGLAANARAARVSAVAGVLMLLAANCYATGQLLVHGDAFSHNPNRHIARLIRYYDPQKIAVIHDDDQTMTWQTYTPIRTDFGPNFPQFVPDPDQSSSTGLRVLEYPTQKVSADLISLPFPYLMVLRSELRNGKEIASELKVGTIPMGDGPIARALLASGTWERIDQQNYLAFTAANVSVFRKVNHP